MSLAAWKDWARSLKIEVRALKLAAGDPRVPWYAKVAAACVVAYAVSPIDLVPDFVPVLGYVDDLVLLPLGVLAVRRMIPADVLADCRTRAAAMTTRPAGWIAALMIVALWLCGGVATARWIAAAR